MNSSITKGVHRGQVKTENLNYCRVDTSSMCSDNMQNRLTKGVSPIRPQHHANHSRPQSLHYGHTFDQSPTRSQAQIPEHLIQQEVVEHEDSLTSTCDITRAHSAIHEGRQSQFSNQEISTTGNKTIKIILEDPSTAAITNKKPDPHPQEKLEKFWGVFEPEYFGKITRVLPKSLIESSPATSKQAGDRSHCAFRSYEEARSRCIRDVKRIIRECRTHNKRYTDTHFDIERDLKITKRRDCLDGLYNIYASGGSNREISNPTDVKRVCEIFEKPTFFASGAGFDDIIQGALGDCWLLAAFSILTCSEKLVRDVCVIHDTEVGVYGFVFYRDGDWHQCIIDDKLYLRAPSYDESGDVVLGMYGVVQRDQERSYNDLFQKGSKSLYFASCRDENATWVPLLEKALAKAHGSYAALAGGQTGEAIEDLTGGVTTEIYTTNILNKDRFWYDELRKIGTDFVFSAAAAAYREWRAPHSSTVRNERRQGIVSGHAYAILDTYEGHGQRLVKMRNPWGMSEWTGPWSDGSKEWTPEWIERLKHKFGDDGIFWISYDDMLKKYKYLDRTRIFSKEWHVAQQWTSVQVPWNTTDYQQTRFQIDVPEDTEAVIVLSQLDDRYFRGLQGKYDYTLQFRIQKDDDEEDEYISRSAHNYELVRSNNVEVPLEKGKYTVLFKVEARKTGRKDVEAIIRDNIWRKEKLMQMGALYDLAHQKGQQTADRPKKETVPAPADSENKGEVAATNEDDKNKDPNRDPWNAFCVVGLQVYSKQESMRLKVVHRDEDEEPAPPVLDRDDIAKAPLQEAQQNSEKTPEGSVVGEDQVLNAKPVEDDVANKKPSDQPTLDSAKPENEPKPEPFTSDEKVPEVPATIVANTATENGDEKPEDSNPSDPASVDRIPDKIDIESSQIMDDLAGDKDGRFTLR